VQPPLPPFPAGGFNGFDPANPGTSSARRETGSVGSRAPGISAFGDQRVRVPGATLGDLPDAPQSAAPGESPSRPPYTGPDAGPVTTPGPLRQTSNGLPVRGSGAATSRPGEPGYPAPSQGADDFAPAVEAQGGSGFAPRPAENDGPPPARRQDNTNPYAASAAQAVAGQRSGMFGGRAADAPVVPQPRTPIESPAAQHGTAAVPSSATGTARPVSASASVPMASRVLPPLDGDESVQPAAAPRARVYGRTPQADPGTAAQPPAGAVPAPAFGGHREPESAARDAGVRDPGAHEPTGPGPAAGEPVRDAGAYGSGFAAPEQRAGTPLSPAAPPAPPAAVRATASARVTPPPNGHSFAPGSPAAPPTGGAPVRPDTVPYSEPTSDLAGRGHGPAAPQAPYGEHTSDLAGRGPYVPAPALPTLHPSVPADARTSGFAGRTGAPGVYPGTTSRATVTPPGPADTSSWSGPADQGEQGRFDAFKPEIKAEVTPAADADKSEPPNVSKLPVLLGIILVSALLLGGALGIVWLLARPSSSGFDVNVGQCVKRNGDNAVTATCGDAGAYEVVSKVDTKEQCADPRLPYVLNPAGNGRSQVLCLKPRG
jgi:hypothetical protein